MAFVNLLQAVYPVGSVYLSTVSTSPASVVGGTWSAMTGGMLGLAGSTGVASAASNGGSLKISINQMPAHTHTITRTLQNTVTSGGKNLVAAGSTEGGAYDWTSSSTGGARTTFPLIPPYTVGEGRHRKVGEC